MAAFDETQDPIEYANAWKDEIHRRLLQMGWEYADVRQALDSEPWHAAKWYRRRYRQPDLEIVCDAMEGEDTSVQSDLPLSFSSTGRKYADRVVYRYRIPNPDASENVGDNTEKPPSFDSTGEADPMSFI